MSLKSLNQSFDSMKKKKKKEERKEKERKQDGRKTSQN